ncbi:hypothetical protein DERP_001944 [Dermatophagoides pteronyssinus]|uniref:Uncharacterized protein n=1 Tax=Dermatophagoides pteronyssinus TaxID=6956 RepID=A0ABQ8JBY3_DERPT|nr:hypothetical protein DERP_001944 [Dermatophagoides pteronyssinus]
MFFIFQTTTTKRIIKNFTYTDMLLIEKFENHHHQQQQQQAKMFQCNRPIKSPGPGCLQCLINDS